MDGLTHNLPFAQYRAIPALNASAIKEGRTSMKHMRKEVLKGGNDTEAKKRGTLVHSALFDPSFWNSVLINDDHRNSNKYEAFCLANPTATILKTSQREDLLESVASVLASKDAVDLLARCQYEVSAVWQRGGLGACKARFDALANDGTFFIDLKTCSSIEPRAVGAQFVSLGYDIQYGWYRFGNESINGKRAKVYQFNLEIASPYDFTIDEVYSESCDEGLSKAIDIATRYRECEKLGVYPGVRGYIAKMELPEWYKERLDLSADLPFGDLD
jgi:hypothetical protein